MKIAILGANILQNKLVLKAKELGIESHVFSLPIGAIAKENSDFFYPISVTEKKEILKICKRVKIDGICSIASDVAMPTVNYIAQEMNLIGNTLECTKMTTNKYEMRKILSKNGIPCPNFFLAENLKEIETKILNFPLIMKPIDRSGSRGIFKVNTVKELKENFYKSLNESFSKKVIIEEYIDGDEYSIEGISQNGKHNILQITKKYTTGSPNFIEIGHLEPAGLDENIVKKIKKIIFQSLDTLKIQNGASHSEIKINKGKIKIIEIAGRMGGDFIGSNLVQASTGIDFLKLVLNVALNIEIDLNVKNLKYISLVKFILTLEDLEKAKKILKKYKENIEECIIEKNWKKTKDSASRNGFYILKFNNEHELEKIKDEIFG